jgi:hypothetical protein
MLRLMLIVMKLGGVVGVGLGLGEPGVGEGWGATGTGVIGVRGAGRGRPGDGGGRGSAAPAVPDESCGGDSQNQDPKDGPAQPSGHVLPAGAPSSDPSLSTATQGLGRSLRRPLRDAPRNSWPTLEMPIRCRARGPGATDLSLRLAFRFTYCARVDELRQT